MFAVDSTMCKCWLLCKRKFYWRHIRNLVPNVPERAPSAGAALHKGLETLHNTMDLATAKDGLCREWDALGIESDEVYNKERFSRILDKYVEKYPSDDEPVTVLGVPEQGFALPLMSNIIYCGRIDRVVERNGQLLIFDHKTRGRGGFSETWRKSFNPDLQMSGYCWAAQQILGRPCKGAIIDGIFVSWAKSQTFDFLRVPVQRSDWELERFERSAQNIAMGIVNASDPPDGPTLDDVYPMSDISTSCSAYNKPCAYRDLCLSQDPEIWAKSDGFRVEPWSPYQLVEKENSDGQD